MTPYAGPMRMRMDELGPEQVGKVLTWEVPREASGSNRYAPITRRMLVRAVRVNHGAPPGYEEVFPEGVVALHADRGGPFYVGAHWPVDVEDAA